MIFSDIGFGSRSQVKSVNIEQGPRSVADLLPSENYIRLCDYVTHMFSKLHCLSNRIFLEPKATPTKATLSLSAHCVDSVGLK